MNARRIARSYTEMVVGMLAGMVLLEPWWPGSADAVEVQALIMATDMSIGMAAVMLLRRHGTRSTLAMCAVMYVPFIALLAPYHAGWIGAGTYFDLGHVLMLLLMLLLVCRGSRVPAALAGAPSHVARPLPAPTSERSSS